MKKKIPIETSEYIKKVSYIAVSFPVYYVDEYGYYCYSENGQATVEIGLNGVQTNPKDSHSIKVRGYFSGEGYQKRKRDLTLYEWREALKKVCKQVEIMISDTM